MVSDQVCVGISQVCEAIVVLWCSDSLPEAMCEQSSLWKRGVMLPPLRADARRARRSVSVSAEWKAASGVLRYLLR